MDLLKKYNVYNEKGGILTSDYMLSKLRCTCVIKNGFPHGSLVGCKFSKLSNYKSLLAYAHDNGFITIYDTTFPQSQLTQLGLCKSLTAFSWSEQHLKLAVGNINGHLHSVDILKDSGFRLCVVGSVGIGSVKTICFKPEQSDIIVAGGSCGSICMWDSRQISCLSLIRCTLSEISSVTYINDYNIITTASCDPLIKVWDTRLLFNKHCLPLPIYTIDFRREAFNCKGFHHAVANSSKTRMFAFSDNSRLLSIDLMNLCVIPDLYYTLPHSHASYLKCALTSDEKYLTAVDVSNDVYLWKLNYSSSPLYRLRSPDIKFISDMDWSNDGDIKLAVSGSSMSPFIWTPHGNYEEKDESEIDPYLLRCSCTKLDATQGIFNNNILKNRAEAQA